MGIDLRTFFKILVVATPLLFISGFFLAAYARSPDVLFVTVSLPILLWLHFFFDATKRMRPNSTSMKLASIFLFITYCGFMLEILLLAFGDESFIFPVFALVGFAILAQGGYFVVVLTKASRARRGLTLGAPKL